MLRFISKKCPPPRQDAHVVRVLKGYIAAFAAVVSVGRHYHADINRSRIGMTECSCNDAKQLNEKDFSLFTFHFSRKRTAFTLAEVLITLGIIGVVAALVIPGLITNIEERQNVARLKKVYSNLSNAYNISYANNGDVKNYIAQYDNEPNWYHEKSHIAFRDYFMNYYNKTASGHITDWRGKVIYYTDFNKSSTYWLADNNTFSSCVTSDGTLYVFRYVGTTIGGYADHGMKVGVIFVIFDYKKGIGQLGKNVFLFSVLYDNRKILPGGYSTVGKDPLELYNNLYAAAQWVLFNENMDYFHCKDLSWNGKKTCK